MSAPTAHASDPPPGRTATWRFKVSMERPNCAQLTLIGGKLQGKVVFSGTYEEFDQVKDPQTILYQSQPFTVQADDAPAGHFFSHWRVTGPLVLDNPRANPLTTRYMTSEPVTLEAIFLPLRPGYHFRLQ